MNAHAPAPDTMSLALRDTVLSPRFYTTDFKALDRVDVTPVRREWDALLAEMDSDPNRNHFKRSEPFANRLENLPEALRKEFVDFLVSSLTSEFSGCVLYAEIAKRANPAFSTKRSRIMASGSISAFSPRPKNTPSSSRNSSFTPCICPRR
jgi:magnesium-protoporphyrin IX monomethyl ester (oxidative) cyclase